MTKRLSTQEKLSELEELAKGPLSVDEIQEIRKALRSANNLIVTKAARITEKCGITELIPQLVAAFERFMAKPAKADQGCFAKTALIEALDTLEYRDSEVFLRGIHHVQMEPVYGGQEDTAAHLRGKCAFALARIEYVDVFFELTSLLTDPESQARIAAVKALNYLGCERSELLLRLKVLTGDEDAQILHECFSGLMHMSPQRSLDFVAKFLMSTDLLIVEGAMMSLGESRLPQAFKILQTYWEDSIDHEFKKMLLLPIALTRNDEAFECLLDIVRFEHQDYALAALTSLKVYADDRTQCQKIQQRVEARDERMISEAYVREFAR